MGGGREGWGGRGVWRLELWSGAHTGGGWLSTITALAALQAVGTEDARREVVSRWHAVPAYIATELANHREGLRRGYTAPRPHTEIPFSPISTPLPPPTHVSPLSHSPPR